MINKLIPIKTILLLITATFLLTGCGEEEKMTKIAFSSMFYIILIFVVVTVFNSSDAFKGLREFFRDISSGLSFLLGFVAFVVYFAADVSYLRYIAGALAVTTIAIHYWGSVEDIQWRAFWAKCVSISVTIIGAIYMINR